MGYADIGTAAVQAQFLPAPAWEAVPFTPANPAIIGASFGKPTAADVRELMALVDFQVDATDKLVKDHQPIPVSAAVPLANWLRWRDAWHAASDRVSANLKTRDSIFVPENRQIATEDYQTLKCAINKSCDESHTDPGDMRNVMNALEKALGEEADLSGFRAKFPETPVGTDPDLEVFKATDAFLKGITPPPLAPKSFLARVPWWVYGLGAVTVGAIGYSFYRTAKRAHAQADWSAGQGTESMPIFHRDPNTGVFTPITPAAASVQAPPAATI